MMTEEYLKYFYNFFPEDISMDIEYTLPFDVETFKNKRRRMTKIQNFHFFQKEQKKLDDQRIQITYQTKKMNHFIGVRMRFGFQITITESKPLCIFSKNETWEIEGTKSYYIEITHVSSHLEKKLNSYFLNLVKTKISENLKLNMNIYFMCSTSVVPQTMFHSHLNKNFKTDEKTSWITCKKYKPIIIKT